MMLKRLFKFPDAKLTARFINLTKASIRAWPVPSEVTVWTKDKKIANRWDKIALKCKGVAELDWQECDKKG